MSKYFHGLTKKHSFFEGWYFKHIQDGNFFAVIPGFHIDHAGRRFAFIEVLTNQFCYYIHYPFSAFEVCKNHLDIQIGENHFSTRGIRLFIDTPELSLRGAIHYTSFEYIPYDTMGPFCFLPFLDCYSNIISLSHSTSGFVKLNGQIIDFDKGKGYIESDWGRSFPKYQLWTQCNSFPTETSCAIVVNIASLHFLNTTFIGCVCAITYQQHHYHFATHLGAKLTEASSRGFILTQGYYRLEAWLLSCSSTSMKSCLRGDMTRTIHRNAKCTVNYHLKYHNQTIFNLASNEASFEWIH